MNDKIKMKEVAIGTEIDGVSLKGVLKYWSKDFYVKMTEPFEGCYTRHLMYIIPAKYVLTKSENPTCVEIELLERSKDILKSIYLSKLKKRKVAIRLKSYQA